MVALWAALTGGGEGIAWAPSVAPQLMQKRSVPALAAWQIEQSIASGEREEVRHDQSETNAFVVADIRWGKVK
jgi:hypothetical protein